MSQVTENILCLSRFFPPLDPALRFALVKVSVAHIGLLGFVCLPVWASLFFVVVSFSMEHSTSAERWR
jgi:hypothetical protein